VKKEKGGDVSKCVHYRKGKKAVPCKRLSTAAQMLHPKKKKETKKETKMRRSIVRRNRTDDIQIVGERGRGGGSE